MPRGGKREGSGRKKGATTKRTREIAEQVVKSGLTPLEYMMRVVRNGRADPGRRDDMAKAAAPYVHPRLTSIEGGDPSKPINLGVKVEEVTEIAAARAVAFLMASGAQAVKKAQQPLRIKKTG